MSQSISVAMCTYNGSRFIEAQLRSILCQSRLPDEVIITDDCSDDTTPEIINSFKTSGNVRIRLIRNPIKLGSTRNFEKAITLCSGDIIVLSDQDDEWYPWKLERIEKEFEAISTAGAIFSDAEIVDESGSPMGYTLWDSIGFSNHERSKFSRDQSFKILLRHNVVNGASMAFRSEYKPLITPFPDSSVHDEWIALLVSATSHLSFIPESLIKYRQHGLQQLGGIKKGIFQQFSESDNYSSDYFLRRAQLFIALKERLSMRSTYNTPPEALHDLDEKIFHLQSRASIIQKKKRWWALWVHNLMQGHYRKYSNGCYSAIRDALLA